MKYLLSILLLTQLLFIQGWASMVRYDAAGCSSGLQGPSERNSIRAVKNAALAPSHDDYDSDSRTALLTTEESFAHTSLAASPAAPRAPPDFIRGAPRFHYDGAFDYDGAAGFIAPRRAPGFDNYRGRYNAERHARGLPRLPDDYDAHHAVPQRYRDHPDFQDFDFDAHDNIRGVKGSRADVNTHQRIMNMWEDFHANNPNAKRAQIEAFRDHIDDLFDNDWF